MDFFKEVVIIKKQFFGKKKIFLQILGVGYDRIMLYVRLISYSFKCDMAFKITIKFKMDYFLFYFIDMSTQEGEGDSN
jgi:hypothetical protein